MPTYTLVHHTAALLDRLQDFFARYVRRYPDARLNPAEFYTYHPALESGENVFCVLDADRNMVGFAPLFAVQTTDAEGITGPHEIWTVLLAAPELENTTPIHDLLWDAVYTRVEQIKADAGLARIHLAADMMSSQQGDLEYLEQIGFKPFERVHVVCRDTAHAVPEVHTPVEISISLSRLETNEEQADYLRMQNTCFPEQPKTNGDLQMLLQSPLWETGQVISACNAQGECVGSILVYRDPVRGWGVTDDVMVEPAWRGQSIGKRLIGEGVNRLRAQGVERAMLEVKASNLPAVNVYLAMGYEIVNQELLMGKFV